MKKNLNISFIILILYTLALFHCQADEQFADKLKFSSQLSHNVGTVDELYAVLKKVKREAKPSSLRMALITMSVWPRIKKVFTSKLRLLVKFILPAQVVYRFQVKIFI